MFKSSLKFLFYSVVLFKFFALADDVSEEMKQKISEMMMSCAKDFALTGTDLEQLKNKQMPDNDNAKCFFACSYKAVGMMGDDGMLSTEGVNTIAQKFYAANPELLEKAKLFTEACKGVNDVEVSDGNKGCERAALIFKCSIEKGPQYDFQM